MKSLNDAKSSIGGFLQEEDGATAIEYALLASGIAALIAAAVFLLGGRIQNVFNRLAGLIR